jgi:manganese/iron transport system permease protein
VLFTGAFALGVFLMSRVKNYAVDLQSFLFGNILGVSVDDVLFIGILGASIAVTVIVLFRGLLYTSFDPVVAKASGVHVETIEYVLLVMLALTIIVALQSVGIILVAALLVTPAAAAYQLTSRFSRMMALAAAMGIISTVGGLYLSYFLRSSSGATIVLLATVLFFLAIAAKQLRSAYARRA